jgi:peptidoglycan/xylan/chitin deacetylase (PgdA/CDA1 family)
VLAATVLSATQVGRYYGLLQNLIAVPVARGVNPAPPADASVFTGADWSRIRWDNDQLSRTSPAPSPDSPVGSVLPPIISRPPPHSGTWVPILMYHYIRYSPDRAGVPLSVLPPDFQAQMHYLKDRGYSTITMRELDLAIRGQHSLPPRPVALTFDDGYQDFFTTAAPVLRALGLTATSYVPTMLVGSPNYMTWPEIQLLDTQGFEMAAHSQFHANVAKVPLGRARVEIFGAKADLERHLGHVVVDWAYPYGAFNPMTVALVNEAGYWSGATTRAGAWHDVTQMPLLTRVRVFGGESLGDFAWRLIPY